MKTKLLINSVLLLSTLSGCGLYRQFKVGDHFHEDKTKGTLSALNLSVDVSSLVSNDIGKGLSSKLVKAVMPNTSYHTLYSYGNELNFFHTSTDMANSSFGHNELKSAIHIPWEYYSDAYFNSKKLAYRTPLYVTKQKTSGNYVYTTGKYKAKKNAWFSYMIVKEESIPSANISHSAVLGYDKKLNQNLTPLLGENAPASAGFIYPLDPRLTDMTDLFTWEMKKNVMIPGAATAGPATGEAILTLKHVSQKKIIPLSVYLAMGNIFTFGTPCLLGYPLGHQRAKVELQLEIKDKTGKTIKTYTAKGHKFQLNSLYYGLAATGARRRTHAIAMHRAFREIKSQVKKDAPVLNAALN